MVLASSTTAISDLLLRFFMSVCWRSFGWRIEMYSTHLEPTASNWVLGFLSKVERIWSSSSAYQRAFRRE